MPDRPSRRRRFSRVKRPCVAALAALLLAAASSPQVGEVQRIPPDQARAVLGGMVSDQDGKEIGRLVDILVGDQGQPQAAVIDFGGFMGVGNRKIAVDWNALRFTPTDTKHPITLNLTQDQIKAAPEYKDAAQPAPVVVAPAPAVTPAPVAVPAPVVAAPTPQAPQ